jgi:hypothetical protein
MMPKLLDARCFNHSRREAVARCPGCARFFCRECITEHEHRVLCAACLRALGQAVASSSRPGIAALSLGGAAALGILVLWILFYLAGQALLLIPSSYHEGTGWEVLWQGRP